MLSFRALPLPFIKSIRAGRLLAMADLIELPLTLRECPGVAFLERDAEAAVGAAKLLKLNVG